MIDKPQGQMWTDRKWLAEPTRWIRARLENKGIRVTGPIEQPHVRPWGTVLSVSTTAGTIYFKATSSELVHEARLTDTLSRRFPECMPELLAIDADRGWMLMHDGGKRLREILQQAPDLSHWERLLPEYAEIQIAMTGSIGELVDSGVPDRRLTIFPNLYDGILGDQEILRIGLNDGLSVSEVKELSGLSQYIVDLCARLMDHGIPATLDHGDFHDGNIFLKGSRYVFFDWGDSSITHPFFSLRTAFVIVEYTLGFEEGAPEFERLIDAYLEPWESIETRSRLEQGFNLARRLWSISAALRWQLVVSPLGGSEREQYLHAVPGLLKEFLEINPVS